MRSKSELHRDIDLGTEEQITKPLDEQRDEPVWLDSQNIIHDKLLHSLNVYSRKSIIVHPSAHRELLTPVQKLRIRRSSKFKESPYTRSSAGNIRIFSQKYSFVYYPIDGIVDMKIVKKFMDWISVDLLKGHVKRKGNVDHYKKGKTAIPMMHFRVETVEDKNWLYTMGFLDQSWTDSEHKRPEYINGFRIHTVVPWHTVEDIYIPVNIKKKYHWVLTVLSFSKRCIFLYDSYKSSGHYLTVLAEIRKLAEIIPMCLQACDFYYKKGIDLQNHSRYKDKDSSDLFDMLCEDNFPQQSSGSL
ncbi:hypothetical protein FXO38_28907 [Capsicum annuum]|nr:hypothetical protein FXO38_28907 [Capsicum annuum]KAF3644929.1 hypothetical protein FXO37_21223 [Capsicum annuum]